MKSNHEWNSYFHHHNHEEIKHSVTEVLLQLQVVARVDKLVVLMTLLVMTLILHIVINIITTISITFIFTVIVFIILIQIIININDYYFYCFCYY